MNFVFDSQVGTSGKLVRNRVVQIDDDLKVGRVTVNEASDYHFGGQGSLKAKELSIAGNLTIILDIDDVISMLIPHISRGYPAIEAIFVDH